MNIGAMKVSVIMASLLRPGWEASLLSACRQSEPPEEIVVVVDRMAPLNERRDLAQRHPGVRFVFNDGNIGLTRSLNVAIAHAGGDVLLRLDDDDICHSDRVAAQKQALRQTGADLVCAFALGKMMESPRVWRIEHATSDAALKSQLAKRNVVVHSTLGYTRQAIERLGGYDAHFRYAQDYALHLRAIREGLTYAVVPRPLVTRIYSPQAITTRRRKQQIMYSSAARLLHAAECGDVGDFQQAMGRSVFRLTVPNAFRDLRRLAFGLVGRGA